MADEVTLLDFWSSPFAIRVRIALAEKGIAYESKEENLSNKSPFLLQMNPVHNQVPVLIHKGKSVCESLNIVEYIDEVWKDKSSLFPSDPYERAHARFWADYVEKKIFSAGRLVWMSKGEARETAKKEFIDCFKVLERELGDKPYFGGKTFGIVDVALIPFYSWFYALETFANFSMEAECPKIVAWANRCMEKESVFKSVADMYRFYDYLVERRKNLGLE